MTGFCGNIVDAAGEALKVARRTWNEVERLE